MELYFLIGMLHTIAMFWMMSEHANSGADLAGAPLMALLCVFFWPVYWLFLIYDVIRTKK